MTWQRASGDMFVEHRDGVPWTAVYAPVVGWRRWTHRHQPQTRGMVHGVWVERCRCGAARLSGRGWIPEQRGR